MRNSLLRIILIPAAILLVPFVAMRFATEVTWGIMDFITAGALVGGACLAYELWAARLHTVWQRVAVGAGLAAVLLLVWLQLAVGVFTLY